jgi:NTP pyrophosphatase (non-canonical NTP hydrolase)
MSSWSIEIQAWATQTFGNATVERALSRAAEEFQELHDALEEGFVTTAWRKQIAEECADVVICLCGVCNALGLDLAEAVERKMAKNRLRTWKLNGDGTAYHMPEAKP